MLTGTEVKSIRAGHVNLRGAFARAKGDEIWLEPWRRTEPGVLLGLAFKLMGENAQRIGNLTITPDMLTALLDAREK